MVKRGAHKQELLSWPPCKGPSFGVTVRIACFWEAGSFGSTRAGGRWTSERVDRGMESPRPHCTDPVRLVWGCTRFGRASGFVCLLACLFSWSDCERTNKDFLFLEMEWWAWEDITWLRCWTLRKACRCSNARWRPQAGSPLLSPWSTALQTIQAPRWRSHRGWTWWDSGRSPSLGSLYYFLQNLSLIIWWLCI